MFSAAAANVSPVNQPNPKGFLRNSKTASEILASNWYSSDSHLFQYIARSSSLLLLKLIKTIIMKPWKSINNLTCTNCSSPSTPSEFNAFTKCNMFKKPICSQHKSTLFKSWACLGIILNWNEWEEGSFHPTPNHDHTFELIIQNNWMRAWIILRISQLITFLMPMTNTLTHHHTF